MRGLFAHVHRATERVLDAHGIVPTAVPGQGCCGALHAHAGQHDDALRLARQNVKTFATLPVDSPIVVNAAGCGAMLKSYERLLAGDSLASQARALAARVRDVSEFVAMMGVRTGASLDIRVAYDPPCHLLHAQGIDQQPLTMLDAIDGLVRVQHDEADLCCGSAGSFTFSQPDISWAVLERKVTALRRIDPDVVATGNPGCIMQIGAGLKAAGVNLPVVHPIELLDASYRQAGFYGS
jgi:glycolate oxidase iron-sulfur subunit